MTADQTLYTGVSRAAWGYFFLYFDFKLGTVSILPSFIGILLFLSAIRLLQEERRDLALLRPLGIFLAAWHFGNWLASWLGTALEGQLLFLDLIAGLATIYFHFQLLTDFAALAVKYQGPEDALDARLLRWRTLQTLLLTAISLPPYLLEWLPAWWETAAAAAAVLYLLAGICLMAALFSLRRLFRTGGVSAAS